MLLTDQVLHVFACLLCRFSERCTSSLLDLPYVAVLNQVDCNSLIFSFLRVQRSLLAVKPTPVSDLTPVASFLPEEVVDIILSHLDLRGQKSCRLATKRINLLVNAHVQVRCYLGGFDCTWAAADQLAPLKSLFIR